MADTREERPQRSGRDRARGPDIRTWVPPPAWRHSLRTPCALDARYGQEATMEEILDTILDPSSQTEDFVGLPLPEAYRAVTLHRDEEHMFAGLDVRDRDPRKSLHIEDVPVPELGLGEALVAVMASAVTTTPCGAPSSPRSPPSPSCAATGSSPSSP